MSWLIAYSVSGFQAALITNGRRPIFRAVRPRSHSRGDRRRDRSGRTPRYWVLRQDGNNRGMDAAAEFRHCKNHGPRRRIATGPPELGVCAWDPNKKYWLRR